MSNTSSKGGAGTGRIIGTMVVCAVIVGVTLALVVLIRSTEPKAQRTGATRKSAALVETMSVSNANYRPVMEALGTVEPVQEIRLQPQVGGRIVSIAPSFRPGGFVREGDLLVTLEADDYEHIVALRESELQEADAQLSIEAGRRVVAEQEFALLDENIDDDSRALVLREPQLAAARARVAAAKASLEQARLDLARTRIKAPFDAQILERSVNAGSQVSTSTELARLVGLNRYWVTTTVPLASLNRIRVPEGDTSGAMAHVRHRTAWPEGVSREGVVESIVGELDRDTRLARVLVSVDDPLALERESPPLVIGSVVGVQIEGREVRDVIRLSRDYVRAGPSVWVYDDGLLAVRDVRIVYEDAYYAYIAEGLEDGDEIVTTSLATVAPGIGLKRIGTDDDPALDEDTP